MAHTLSTMLELGTPAVDFSLPNTNPQYGGDIVSLSDVAGARALLIVFMCNHCPYVVHIRDQLVRFIKEFQEQGLVAVAISSNDVGSHADDGPEKMSEAARQYGFTFPYLYDETQQVAKAYQAACTPDFYLFDRNGDLAYRGQFDSARPRNSEPVTGSDLRRAVTAVLAEAPVPGDQIPSMGCNIKWKSGNEPDYFAAAS